MTRTAIFPTACILAATLLSSSFPAVALAQDAAQPPAPVDLSSRQPAQQVRERFMEILSRQPPALGRVLKLDPALMLNDAYLAPYPEVAQFLRQYPEVPRNPGYFLERVNISTTGYVPTSERALERREFYSMVGGFTAFLVFLVITSVIIWLIRTVIEQRRWGRLSRIQADVHSKLMDRFSSNDELMAYVQTPSGRRFLESGPSPLAESGPAMSAPFARILWSVQAGVVGVMAGIGLIFVSGRLTDEPAQFFYVVGIVTLALGFGFVASAGAAYALSRRLGLFNDAATTTASDHA
jgi:hypothetical protein